METYYKVEYDGASYLEKDPEVVKDILVDMDIDCYYKISKVRMSVDEYEDLKEFDGF